MLLKSEKPGAAGAASGLRSFPSVLTLLHQWVFTRTTSRRGGTWCLHNNNNTPDSPGNASVLTSYAPPPDVSTTDWRRCEHIWRAAAHSDRTPPRLGARDPQE